MSGLRQLHNNSVDDLEKMRSAFDEFRKADTDDSDEDWRARIEELVSDFRYGWLDVPATSDSTNRFDAIEEPLLFKAKRIALNLPHLPTRLHAYQVVVPLQKVGEVARTVHMKKPESDRSCKAIARRLKLFVCKILMITISY